MQRAGASQNAGEMGKQAVTVTSDRMPQAYVQLSGAGGNRTALHVSGKFDATILLEYDSLERTEIGGLDAFCPINIDHHFSGRVTWLSVTHNDMIHACAPS